MLKMQRILIFIARKVGIYDLVWQEFCRQYPIRLSGKTPEVRSYLEAHEKSIGDVLAYGLGCIRYVDASTLSVSQPADEGL